MQISGDCSINRNIVECKEHSDNIRMVFFSVLIETLWNVKNRKDGIPKWSYHVLIETLWNVKFDRGAWHVGVN